MAQATTAVRMTARERTLALEIRPTTFAFVIIEGASRVLEWGVRRRRPGTRPVRVSFEIIAGLITVYNPARIVLRRRQASSRSGKYAAVSHVLRMIRAEAHRRAIEVTVLSTGVIRSFFKQYGCTTKHDIASLLAEWFEELAWRLPPKRKAWQSERYNMLIFDATATAIAFLGRA